VKSPVKSATTPRFWQCFDRLPTPIQALARQKFGLWKADPYQQSLHFKRLAPLPLWSVRVNIQYRALAKETSDGFVWFWIGTHAEYDRLIAG